MAKITMAEGCLLLTKVETKKLKFEVTGNADPTTPIYLVSQSGDVRYKASQTVILKPGNYDHLRIDGADYLYAEGDQVAGVVKS